ncbi:MAG: DUF2271 domain-containing protein [Christensenellales bacterium]|jgi:hypothetical protein
MKKLITVTILLVLVISCLPGCARRGAAPGTGTPQTQPQGSPTAPDADGESAGRLTVSFDYEKQSGSGSNQFAVWVEDDQGQVLETLFATRYTAQGGYEDRPDSLREWVSRANPAQMDQAQLDAISGATPESGEQEFVFDCVNENGRALEEGTYRFFVEGTLKMQSSVLYTGTFVIGEGRQEITPEATYTGEDRPPMIQNVSAVYEED